MLIIERGERENPPPPKSLFRKKGDFAKKRKKRKKAAPFFDQLNRKKKTQRISFGGAGTGEEKGEKPRNKACNHCQAGGKQD